MTDPAVVEKIEKLSATVAMLEARIEDLEDLRDLQQAIADNAGKPLIPWDQVKAEIDLD
jgi:cell division protein FtsB